MSKISYINLADLNLPEFQAHRDVPHEYILEIANSIKEIGIIEPLIVRYTKQGVEIVAGCVRYEAARIAGLKAVPCINMTLDPKAAEILKLHENIKRIPLDHVDQGHTFIMMQETFDMTEQAISDVVGKSVGYVSQHISLVRIDNELTKAVKDKSISFSQARELMRVDDSVERRKFLHYCQNDGATVQILQRWVQEYIRDSSVNRTPTRSIPSQALTYDSSPVSRPCAACGYEFDIKVIRQVFYCPDCDNALKSAISEEKLKNPHNSPD